MMHHIRFSCFHINENNLFNGRIYVIFVSCVKFIWINNNQMPQIKLIYDLMDYIISVYLKKETPL